MRRRGSVYADLGVARSIARREEAIVRLAPLARWVVVTGAEAQAWGAQCGWELESEEGKHGNDETAT